MRTFACQEHAFCILELPNKAPVLSHDSGCAAIVRTRKPDDIAPANVVVDVGGVYDVDTGRFDHHQKSFTGVMSELDFSIRLSSAGLVYR